MPGLQEIRFMSTMKVKIIWTVALSLSCLKGIVTAVKADVKLPGGVNVWNGSCALLPCLYSPGKPAYSSFIWYHNAWYDESIKEYIGAVVYSSSNASAVDSLFAHRVLYMGKDNAQNCTIMLTNLTKEHQGWYSVRLRGERKWMSNNVTVSVSDIGPTLSIGDIPEMRESQRVTLKCSISFYCPYYDINLFWSGDVNGTSKNASKWDTSSLSTTVSFTFQPSWRDDKKNLTCALHRRDGEENRTIQLNVKHAPKNVQILPNNQSTIQIRKPESITLQCLIESSNPQVSQITWYKGNVMYVNTNSDQINVSAAGKYHCQAKNAVGESSSEQVEVIVLYPPKSPMLVLEPDNTTFLEGQAVTFTCVVNRSNPAVRSYTWYKNNKVLPTYTSVYIKTLSADDAGMYACKAENGITGASISPNTPIEIYYAPKGVSIQITGLPVKEGDAMQLQCLAKKSNPLPTTYEWYKNGFLQLNSSTEAVTITTTWTHSGLYSCKAKNAIGSMSSQTTIVDVHYGPKNVTLSLDPGSHLSEFMKVKMTCLAKANPQRLTYVWYRNNVFLYRSHYSFVLPSVQMDDAGEYHCVAEHGISNEKSNKVYLHVSYSTTTIGKFASIAISLFILIMIIILVVRFRSRIQKLCSRKPTEDISDSSFFVLKKSHNQALDNGGQQTPSTHSSTEQVNYATVKCPASTRRQTDQSSIAPNDPDITTIYSVVRKPCKAEYENIALEHKADEDSQDDIHYSVITNLNQKPSDSERGRDPEVEYAMLRHT
ncbi:B-cell receptor CD22-like isoform X3 [Hyperolius riggenbachi]|uniref:B-cell receptor CD22-like isoform X3 n=1 Tax=Hyperolius riggenbachi TaxID=752182 RepID=UPI0035A3CA89